MKNLKVGFKECGYYAKLLPTKFRLKNKTLTLGCSDCICFDIVTPSGKRKNSLKLYKNGNIFMLEYCV